MQCSMVIRSQRDFIKKVLDESSKKTERFKSSGFYKLLLIESYLAEKITELTREWNFIMQDLENYLDPASQENL